MSQIKGKNTKPEMLVRKFFHANGFRFRLHVKDLPGKPDIVLPKYKTAIQVHGCFWHGHSSCKYGGEFSTPSETITEKVYSLKHGLKLRKIALRISIQSNTLFLILK